MTPGGSVSVPEWQSSELYTYTGNITTLYTFGEVPRATSCEFQWRWYTFGLSTGETYHSTVLTLTDYVTTSWTTKRNARMTTLCDGHPRLLEQDSIETNITLPSFVSTSWWSSQGFTSPPPMCTIAPDDCLRLTTSFSSAWTSNLYYWISIRSNGGYTSSICDPECEYWSNWLKSSWVVKSATQFCTAPELPCEPASVSRNCAVGADKVRLIYFPVDVIGGLCDNRTIITATPTIPGKPNTVDFEGTTLTSGYVYLSFHSVYAYSVGRGGYVGEGRFCAPTLTNVLYSVSSAELSSMEGRNGGPYPFNFGDLNGEYPPFSVWEHRGGLECTGHVSGCDWATYSDPIHSSCLSSKRSLCDFYTVPFNPSGYEPNLDIPKFMTRLDPRWSTCVPNWYGVYDPPIALSTVKGITDVPVTTTRHSPTPSATPANPGSLPEPPGTTATGSPNPADPGGSSHGSGSDSSGSAQYDQDPGRETPAESQTSPEENADAVSAPNGAVITVNGVVVTVINGGGNIVIGSTKISSGIAVTLSGTPVSMGSNGVYINGTVVPFSKLPNPSVTQPRGSGSSSEESGRATTSTRTQGGSGQKSDGSLLNSPQIWQCCLWLSFACLLSRVL